MQVKAVFKYTEDLYISGLGAIKQMVFGAITHLKTTESLLKKPPSKRQFQSFLQKNLNLFCTIKAKPIAITRVSAQDIEEVWRWFVNWTAYCEEKNLEASDILNFNETDF